MGISVLVVDGSEIVRKAMCRILDENENMVVVGEAVNFEEMVNALLETSPDVVILDLSMPAKNGLTVEHVRSALESVCTVAVSLANDEEAEELSKAYGARCLVDKMQLYSKLNPTIIECFRQDAQNSQDA
jgi:chemotaxis response regulator CheB